MYTGSPLPDNLLRVQLGLTNRQHGAEVNRNMFSGLIPEIPSDSGHWPKTFFLLPPVLVRITIAIHAMAQAPRQPQYLQPARNADSLLPLIKHYLLGPEHPLKSKAKLSDPGLEGKEAMKTGAQGSSLGPDSPTWHLHN